MSMSTLLVFFIFILRCYTFQYFFLSRLIFQIFFSRNWNFFYQESQICDSPGIIVDKRHFRFFLTTGNWFDGSLGLFRFKFTFMAIILLLMGVGFLLIHILLFLCGQFIVLLPNNFIWFRLTNTALKASPKFYFYL